MTQHQETERWPPRAEDAPAPPGARSWHRGRGAAASAHDDAGAIPFNDVVRTHALGGRVQYLRRWLHGDPGTRNLGAGLRVFQVRTHGYPSWRVHPDDVDELVGRFRRAGVATPDARRRSPSDHIPQPRRVPTVPALF